MGNGSAIATASSVSERSASRFRAFRWLDIVLIVLAVGGAHFAYRVSTIGLPPFTDGGSHACYGYFARAGTPSTACHPINLYPALVSSLGIDRDAPLLRGRLIDAVFCTLSVIATALLIYRLSSRTTAIILGLMWTVAWLHPVIGNAGFKNTILPAFGLFSVCLLLWTHRGRVPLVWGGALIPLIPLVREPMAITALVLPVCCWLLQGRRGLGLALLGAIASGTVLLGWVWLFRGSPLEILARYGDLGDMFHTFSATYMPLGAEAMRSSLTGSLVAARMLAAAGLIGALLLLMAVAWQRRPLDWRWLAVAALVLLFPLLEITTKAPFPYHWIQLGLGLILLAALGYRALETISEPRRKVAALVAANSLLAALLGAQLLLSRETIRHGVAQSKHFESVMVEGNWEHFSVSDSLYLRLAKYIRDNTDPEDTVFVSGFYYVLYPLSQRLPPDIRFHDATFASLAGLDQSASAAISAAFSARRPQLVVESLRWNDTFRRIGLFIPGFPGDYELVAELPNDLPIHYGEFGARIWRLRDAQPARTDSELRMTANSPSAVER
jgi:hypothetical protein